MHVDQTKTYM